MIKKKNKAHAHENTERWLVSYADFITLLFAFFVVMYATSTNNLEKQKSFEESVRSKLHLSLTSSTSEGANSGAVANPLTETLQELRQPIAELPKNPSPRELKDFVDRKMAMGSLKSFKDSVTDVKHEWFGVRVSLAASTFFDPGSYKLKLSSLEALDTFFSEFKKRDSRIIVEGHTDNTPIKNGKIESNWELSSLRATSVVRYLIKYHNFREGMVTAAAYADTKPLVHNDTEQNKQKNRRIDILIISDEKINQEGL
ncbi:MAG: OmpA family protein [Bdellovibrionaceae bacterium]|nr:OmpA family protein [Pseudobdellovibrionaceae bacterium]